MLTKVDFGTEKVKQQKPKPKWKSKQQVHWEAIATFSAVCTLPPNIEAKTYTNYLCLKTSPTHQNKEVNITSEEAVISSIGSTDLQRCNHE